MTIVASSMVRSPTAQAISVALFGGGYVPLIENGVLHSAFTFTRADATTCATYFDSAGVMQLAAANVPRFDHDPDTLALRGLLVEEQRTNLLLRSAEFDNASWTKVGGSVTQNATTSPDGATAADLFVEDSASSGHGLDQAATVSGAVTLSFYVKYAGRQWIRLDPYGTASPGTDSVWFDILNGVKGTQQANCVGTITSVGNGWYRITWTATCSAASLTVSVRGSSADNNSSNYVWFGANAFYIWGAQLEAGSFATSYIPTAGSAVTRASDAASVPKASISYNESQSTVYAEYDLLWATPSTTSGLVGIDANGRFVYWTGNLVPSIYDGTTIRGGDAVNGSLGANKTAAGFGPAGIAIASNGGAAISSAFDGVFGAAASLNVGSAGTGSPLCGHIKNLRYYPRQLTGAELQAVTA